MNAPITQAVLDDLTEKLAAIEHERWAHWQRYVHSKCDRRPDGSLIIPADLVAHWERQIATPYRSLADSEKDADRQQVRRYLPIVLELIADSKQASKE